LVGNKLNLQERSTERKDDSVRSRYNLLQLSQMQNMGKRSYAYVHGDTVICGAISTKEMDTGPVRTYGWPLLS
jgi:hypothetical protein